MTRTRRGFTLVEMLVVLAILALAVGLVAISVPALAPPETARVPRAIAAARAEAIRTGRAVTLEVAPGARIRLYPDGSAAPTRVSADGADWVVDPWTAEVRRAP